MSKLTPIKNYLNRRSFIKQTGLAGASGFLSASMWPQILNGNPFEQLKSETTDTSWLKSLYERGKVTTYLKSKNELNYIGMPVGGVNAGGLYMSGDGRLWLWDIFNLNQEGINPVDIPWGEDIHSGKYIRSRDGASYVAPPKADEVRLLEQGIAIKFEMNGETIIKTLNQDDWEEVMFEATYPVARITYYDKNLPVRVVLQAYSPFIPLDIDNSSLPATILSVEIKNNGKAPLKINVAGWLENKTALHTATANRLERRNARFKEKGATGIYCTLEGSFFGNKEFEKSFDYGTLCFATISENAIANVALASLDGHGLFENNNAETSLKAAQQMLVGGLTSTVIVEQGKSETVPFIIGWHTPNFTIQGGKVLPEADRGRHYDNRFKNAKEVAIYLCNNYKKLSESTLLWKNTWYDSSMPHWFLERCFLNIGNLATTTSHRFKSGRYWAWEGVGACEGNCTHVWHYAQAIGRIFPAMEKDNRERVDLGLAQQPDGGIWFRAEYQKRPAVDGQAGRILGCLREHQMSADNSFLKKNWERIKRATQFIINMDRNKDGMEDVPLENTLDAIWDGEIAWIVGLCIAAIKAGQVMAEEMNDSVFAQICKDYVERGSKNMSEKLFNGEYFIHRPDPKKGRKGLGSYNTCHIDQVLGQSWAFQVGLGRVIDQRQTLSALRALWKYNFIKDMGEYAKTHKGARPYALSGESGMVMNTNPQNEPNPYGDNVSWQMGYFHECMTGFEHQVASHMMAEGMTDEALMLTRAIHDRYHAAKRNPFNEIECSDHYGRALASYGTFITACGFEYHGPNGYIHFAPKWNKEDFKTPFTAAEGWGSFSQQITDSKQKAVLDIKYGKLRLIEVGLAKEHSKIPEKVTVLLGSKPVVAQIKTKGEQVSVVFSEHVDLFPGTPLILEIE